MCEEGGERGDIQQQQKYKQGHTQKLTNTSIPNTRNTETSTRQKTNITGENIQTQTILNAKTNNPHAKKLTCRNKSSQTTQYHTQKQTTSHAKTNIITLKNKELMQKENKSTRKKRYTQKTNNSHAKTHSNEPLQT